MLKIVVAIILSVAASLPVGLAVSQPAYQVTVWLKPQFGSSGSNVRLCNGVIIHERLILLTADCLLQRRSDTNLIRVIDPSMLYITAGNKNATHDVVFRNAYGVEIASTFDQRTLDNDIAILKLNTSLPLGERPDMKWIIIDDGEWIQQSCTASFQPQNTLSRFARMVNYEPLEVLSHGNCSRLSPYPYSRRQDICSYFAITPGSYCNLTNTSLQANPNRGGGFVCNNQLVALLSHIFPANRTMQECERVSKLPAFYTYIRPHLGWIYERIAYESIADMNNPHYELAAPYDGPPVPSPMLPSTTTLATTTTSSTSSTTNNTGQTLKPSIGGQKNSANALLGLDGNVLTAFFILLSQFMF